MTKSHAPLSDSFSLVRDCLAARFGVACASQPRPAQSSSPGQSYAAAIRQICEVDSHIAPEQNDNELEQGQLREDYILAHTENPDAIYFVTLWRTKPKEEQARSLREEAKAQGLGECALAEALAPHR